MRRAGSRTCDSRWSACSRRRSGSQAWMSCHAVPRPSLQQFAIVVRVSANSCAVIHQLYWIEQKGSSGSPTVRRKYPRTAIMSSIHGWPAPDCTPQKPSPPVHPVDAGELLAARLVSVLIDTGRPTALALRFPGPIETHSRDSKYIFTSWPSRCSLLLLLLLLLFLCVVSFALALPQGSL